MLGRDLGDDTGTDDTLRDRPRGGFGVMIQPVDKDIARYEARIAAAGG